MKYITLKDLECLPVIDHTFKSGEFLSLFNLGQGKVGIIIYDADFWAIIQSILPSTELSPSIELGLYEIIGEDSVRPGMYVEWKGEKHYYVGDDPDKYRFLSHCATGEIVCICPAETLKPWKESKEPSIEDLKPEHLEFFRDMKGVRFYLDTDSGRWSLVNEDYFCADMSKFIKRHYPWHNYKGSVEINLTPITEDESND